jgi:hypothetical protein
MSAPTPPAAERRAHTVERFGERLEDPWFWLRDREDPAVRAYLEAENAYAEAVLAPASALREGLYQEMLARIKQTDLSVPYRYRGFHYYSRTEEGKQYPIHCGSGDPEAPEACSRSQRPAAGKSFMALGEFDVSDDGNLLAYSTGGLASGVHAEGEGPAKRAHLEVRIEHRGPRPGPPMASGSSTSPRTKPSDPASSGATGSAATITSCVLKATSHSGSAWAVGAGNGW